MDGAGKVDGSIVVALPVDRWSTGPAKEEQDHTFEGGGLTFWDGRETRVDAASGRKSSVPCEIHHDTRSGDVAFIDRYVACGCFQLSVRWVFIRIGAYD